MSSQPSGKPAVTHSARPKPSASASASKRPKRYHVQYRVEAFIDDFWDPHGHFGGHRGLIVYGVAGTNRTKHVFDDFDRDTELPKDGIIFSAEQRVQSGQVVQMDVGFTGIRVEKVRYIWCWILIKEEGTLSYKTQLDYAQFYRGQKQLTYQLRAKIPPQLD
jgi:hypothetical protein